MFLAALVIPATALLGTLAFRALPALVDPKQATLVSLTLGVLVSARRRLRLAPPAPGRPFVEGLRLMDTIGWAAVLPQMLASLGAVFAVAGVGDVVGGWSAARSRRAACSARCSPMRSG